MTKRLQQATFMVLIIAFTVSCKKEVQPATPLPHAFEVFSTGEKTSTSIKLGIFLQNCCYTDSVRLGIVYRTNARYLLYDAFDSLKGDRRVFYNIPSGINKSDTFYFNVESLIPGGVYTFTAFMETTFWNIGTSIRDTMPTVQPMFTKGVGVDEHETVIINGREWMAQNLRSTNLSYPGGLLFWRGHTSHDSAWTAGVSQAFYGNHYVQQGSTQEFGYSYNHFAAATQANICPKGWHVPTKKEYQDLIDFLGGPSIAAAALKLSGTEYWRDPNSGATNASGMSFLPTVYRDSSFYGPAGVETMIWTSTYNPGTKTGTALYFQNTSSEVKFIEKPRHIGYFCRCVKD